MIPIKTATLTPARNLVHKNKNCHFAINKNSPNSQNEVNNAVGLQFLIDAMNGVQLVDFFLELSCDLKSKGWGNKDRKRRRGRREGRRGRREGRRGRREGRRGRREGRRTEVGEKDGGRGEGDGGRGEGEGGRGEGRR